MAEQVRVTSIDALERFRADLINFLHTAHRSLDEVSDEVRRVGHWLENDQRVHWENEMKRRKRVLDQAEAELFAAKLSALRDTTSGQQQAVRKAKAAFTEAEEKLRAIKKWNRDFEGLADPLLKGLGSMREFIDHDMPHALAYLVQAQRTLEDYAETRGRADAPAAEAAEQP
jgi:hypothetical protein